MLSPVHESGARGRTPFRVTRERAAANAPLLSHRQRQVLSVVVSSYVGGGGPVASERVATLLPVQLSPQSVRTTLAALGELGLVGKAHRSAGRVPTGDGLRIFVEQLLAPRELGPFEKRELLESFDVARRDGFAGVATRLLFERTRQLSFFRTPRLERAVLRHVSLVRVSSERVLAVLVTADGRACQRVFEAPGARDQGELDRLASLLRARVAGRTLAEVRKRLLREVGDARSQALRLLAHLLHGARAEFAARGDDEVVLSTRLVLLEQPEFQEPARLRALLRALEQKERLVALLDRVTSKSGVQVVFDVEFDDVSLRHCALVTAPYGQADAPLGALGVIGPLRMDYARVIPLVGYLSRTLTGMLAA